MPRIHTSKSFSFFSDFLKKKAYKFFSEKYLDTNRVIFLNITNNPPKAFRGSAVMLGFKASACILSFCCFSMEVLDFRRRVSDDDNTKSVGKVKEQSNQVQGCKQESGGVVKPRLKGNCCV